MSKRWIACISFTLGIITALGTMRVEAALAQSRDGRVPNTDPLGNGRAIVDGFAVVDGAADMLGGVRDVPRFEPLNTRPIFMRMLFARNFQVLDGLDCRTCDFQDAHLIYAGGPFNLEGAHFSGNMSLQFIGAAANTISMLNLLGLLQESNAEIVQPQNNKPIERTAPVKRQSTAPIDFGAPYIGRE
jgi:hypothetical protein